jgi:hypothetical protein
LLLLLLLILLLILLTTTVTVAVLLDPGYFARQPALPRRQTLSVAVRVEFGSKF